LICSINIYDQIITFYVSFEDVTQFGVNHLPVCCIMNIQHVVNEWVREDYNNYIFGYRMIWKAVKVEKYKQVLTDEYNTNQFHYFEQCYNTVKLDGVLSIIENAYKCAARETALTKTEAKRSTWKHDKTVAWWDKELQQMDSLINKCLNRYRAK